MNDFKTVETVDFNENPFNIIGKEWMLITAMKDGKVNTMTAAWGGLGVMWNKDVTFVVIRDSRYTKEFVDDADGFSLSFLDHEKYLKELGYIGKISGRDEDKIKVCGFNVEMEGEVPYIKEAEKVIICKKMSSQLISVESFIDQEIDDRFYADNDYHNMYISSIEKILIK